MAKRGKLTSKEVNGKIYLRRGGEYAGQVATGGAKIDNSASLELTESSAAAEESPSSPSDSSTLTSMQDTVMKRVRESSPVRRPLRFRVAHQGRKAVLAASTLAIAVGALTACGGGTQDQLLTQQAQAVNHPPFIAETIQGAVVADETYDIRQDKGDPGTVIVLWYGGQSLFGHSYSAAVVYKENDGRLIPLRSCPVPTGDIFHTRTTGKTTSRHHPISEAMDDDTTRVHCETAEEAKAAGHPNPMLIVEGVSGGFLGFGGGQPTRAEFGFL